MWDNKDLDLLYSPVTHVAHIEFTSHCNLRCVFCPVSQPGYKGRNMESSFIYEMADILIERKIKNLAVNGRGETTIAKDWDQHCANLLDRGMTLSIITNFMKELNSHEAEVLSQFHNIGISCDTVDTKLFPKMRRGGDFRNILLNMNKVRTAVLKRGSDHLPQFTWSCVINDKNVHHMVDYVLAGLAAGVDKFTFCNYIKHPDIEGADNVYPISYMDEEELRSAFSTFKEALRLVEITGKQLTIPAGLFDSVEAKEAGIQHNIPEEVKKTFGDRRFAEVKEGHTRDCLSPWTFALIQADKAVRPCCGKPVIGFMDQNIGLEDILNGEDMRGLRRSLLTGELDDLCRCCPFKPIIEIQKFQKKISDFARKASKQAVIPAAAHCACQS